MTQGKCKKCGTKVDFEDYCIYDGKHYHESCLIGVLSEIRYKFLQKAKRGMITLEEADELQSITMMLERMQNIKLPPVSAMLRIHGTANGSG